MFYFNKATSTSKPIASTELQIQKTWWLRIFSLFTAGSVSGSNASELAQDTSGSNSYINQPGMFKVRSFSPEVAVRDLRRLEGGWVYNNFNQIR